MLWWKHLMLMFTSNIFEKWLLITHTHAVFCSCLCWLNVWIPVCFCTVCFIMVQWQSFFRSICPQGHRRGFTEVTRYILLLQLFKKNLSLPSPLSLWDKICVMYCNLVSVLADVQFCFLIGCDAYLAFGGT